MLTIARPAWPTSDCEDKYESRIVVNVNVQSRVKAGLEFQEVHMHRAPELQFYANWSAGIKSRGNTNM